MTSQPGCSPSCSWPSTRSSAWTRRRAGPLLRRGGVAPRPPRLLRGGGLRPRRRNHRGRRPRRGPFAQRRSGRTHGQSSRCRGAARPGPVRGADRVGRRPAATVVAPVRAAGGAGRHGGPRRPRVGAPLGGLGRDAIHTGQPASRLRVPTSAAGPGLGWGHSEPTETESFKWAVGDHRRPAGRTTLRLRSPHPAGGGRSQPRLPVLPRFGGRHPSRAGDAGSRRGVAGPGGAEPVPGVRGRGLDVRAQPRPRSRAGRRQRHPRGDRAVARPLRRAGRTSTTTCRRW